MHRNGIYQDAPFESSRRGQSGRGIAAYARARCVYRWWIFPRPVGSDGPRHPCSL